MSTSNKPLWAKMLAAYVEVSGSFTDNLGNEQLPGPDREEMAAMLRVIADEVVPFELSPGGYQPECDHEHAAWAERLRIRQRLHAEAERAEVGQ